MAPSRASISVTARSTTVASPTSKGGRFRGDARSPQLRCRGGESACISAVQYDPSAGLGQPARHGKTEATARPGNQCQPPRKVEQSLRHGRIPAYEVIASPDVILSLLMIFTQVV